MLADGSIGSASAAQFVRRAGNAGVVMAATQPPTLQISSVAGANILEDEQQLQLMLACAADPTQSQGIAMPMATPSASTVIGKPTMHPLISPYAAASMMSLSASSDLMSPALHAQQVPISMQSMFPLTPASSPPLAFAAHSSPPSVPGTPLWCVRPAKVAKPPPIPIKSKGAQSADVLVPPSVKEARAAEDNKDGCDGQKKPRRRRSFKELVRNIECKHEGCGRVYATESSLQTHIRLKHNSMRPPGDERVVKRKNSTSSGGSSAGPARPRTISLPEPQLAAALHHIEAFRSFSEPCWGGLLSATPSAPTPDSLTSDPSPPGYDLVSDPDYLAMADAVHIDSLDFSLDTDLAHLCSEVDAMIEACS